MNWSHQGTCLVSPPALVTQELDPGSEWAEVPGQPVCPMQPDSSNIALAAPWNKIKTLLPRNPSGQKGHILYIGGKIYIHQGLEIYSRSKFANTSSAPSWPPLSMVGVASGFWHFPCQAFPSLQLTQLVSSEACTVLHTQSRTQNGRACGPGKGLMHWEETAHHPRYSVVGSSLNSFEPRVPSPVR